jgi:flagellar biosynthesis/type III secretory pathway protein FliH
MAHGKDEDPKKSLQIALAAQMASAGLDDDRSGLYFDLILHSLSEAARQAFRTMKQAKYEYQSDFARRYYGQGRAEGRAEGQAQGRAELVLRQLTLRFGALSSELHARILAASIEELDAIGERLLTVQTLDEALTAGSSLTP